MNEKKVNSKRTLHRRNSSKWWSTHTACLSSQVGALCHMFTSLVDVALMDTSTAENKNVLCGLNTDRTLLHLISQLVHPGSSSTAGSQSYKRN